MYPRQLGIAPAIIAAALPAASKALENLFAGHSATYTDTLNTIPQLQSAAMSGNVCAYIVLKSLSGDQTYCRQSIDMCHQIGTHVGQAGPCGGADEHTKSLARAAWQAVDASPNAFAVQTGAQQVAATGNPNAAPTVLTASVGGIPIWLLGAAALGAIVLSAPRKRAA